MGCGKSRRNLELIETAYKILEEIEPASVRAVCYQLFNRKLIPSMEKKHTSRVSKQLTDAREQGAIPWAWIVDETRAPEVVSAWQDITQYLRTIKYAYRRDSWADQPERIEVWSEKGTVRGTIASVLEEYGVTFRVLHGFSSATVIHDVAAESRGAKPLTILYIGDWDPSGLVMSERDLPDRLERYGAKTVTLRRIALIKRHTVQLGYAPSFPAKDKHLDKNFRWFVANYGRRCWELDAMSPVDLRQVVETAIRDRIEWEAIEAFRAARRLTGRRETAINRSLSLLRALFNWSVLNGYVSQTPFKVGNVTAIKQAREEKRTRRLQPGEEERLLAAAEHRALHDLIIAALQTGCRRGELLSLQWEQVGVDLFLPARKTKAHKDRRVPISKRLRTVLAGRRNDPAGEPLPGSAYVFGDEVGRRRRSIHTVWRSTRKRAGLGDLRFHDLRREAGSRWMDGGVDLATIQRWLGHANIAQTSTYLSASHGNDDAAMRAFEERIGRLTHVDVSRGSNGSEPMPTHQGMFEKTQSNPVVPEPSGMVH